MSGYDQLKRGLEMINELGMDDPRTHEALAGAITSGDLDSEALASAYGALGQCYHGTGRQSEAATVLAKGIALTEEPRKLAIMHHELGETFFVLEREAQAEGHYRQALALDRQHPYAIDTMLLLARALYMRSDGGPEALDESYGYAQEALAVLRSPQGSDYVLFEGRTKAEFDALFIGAICKSEMSSDRHRFEAAESFEEAERLALDNRDEIANQELANVYTSWIEMLWRMGRERDALLVADRASRNLPGFTWRPS